MPGTAEQLTQRPITVRQAATQPASVSTEGRSVEAVVATEREVTVLDLETFQIIDEVLLLDGARTPDQAPLLDSHWRLDTMDQLGSAANFRSSGGQMTALLRMGPEGPADSRIEHVWRLISDGHLRNVSIGYRVTKAQRIAAGESGTVNGRTFTAGDLDLRIATEWRLMEVSVTPIPADEQTGIRKAVTTSRPGGEPAPQSNKRSDGMCECGKRNGNQGLQVRGEALGAELTDLIDDEATDDRPASQVEQELAEAAGVEVSTVQQIKNGELDCPSRDRLQSFADLLDVSVDTLVSAAEEDGCTFGESESGEGDGGSNGGNSGGGGGEGGSNNGGE